jgi:GDSL-like Lipase/Acylhydrolase family
MMPKALESLMPHLALLGDSIFDNVAYTNGGPEVVSQVRAHLPPGWSASLLAVDGSTTHNVRDQVQRLPQEATHIVLSVGGNDALTYGSRLGIALFGNRGTSTENSLYSLADIHDEFETHYRSAVDACLRPSLPLTVCTIYNGCFPDQAYQRIASLALALFNDVILNIAIERSLPVIDLRSICTDPQDYANPIEPSSIGGDKIARVIVAQVIGSDGNARETGIFTTP